MPTLEERIQKLEDESAIRDLIACFADTCSHCDLDAFAKLWIPDDLGEPTWTLSEPFPMSATGIEKILAMCGTLRSPRHFFIQGVHSGVIEIHGDDATGRWIMREVATGPGDVYYNNYAVYRDKYEKKNGKWYFARRDYQYHFLDSSPFEGKVYAPPVLSSTQI